MVKRNWIIGIAVLALGLLIGACGGPNPQPAGLTPIPTLAPGQTPTLLTALSGASAASANVPAGAADAAGGAAIYFENCAPCHGLEGEGVDGPALRNNAFIQAGNDQAVRDVVGGGRGQMPAWLQANGGSLTSGEIANVVAYLHSLQGVPPQPSATPQPPEPTETPLPANAPTEEPAQPSNAGGTGKAVTLTGDLARGRTAYGQFCATCHGPQGRAGRPNPDSDDGAVPGINPIDPTIANADPKVFAANLDLFIEHGSVPSGANPQLMMPAFGDGKLLTDQQIADIIAYVISLNSGQ